MKARFTHGFWRLLEGLSHALRLEDLIQNARTAP